MNKRFHKALLLSLSMLFAVSLSLGLSRFFADDWKERHAPLVNMELAIPQAFENWQVDSTPRVQFVDPATRGKVRQIYTQVVARTYVNDKNQKVMLSVAYGNDQLTHRTHAHPQEDCYAAQGFKVQDIEDQEIPVMGRQLPIRRLFASQFARSERVSYWTTVGTSARLPGWGRKLEQLKFGFLGKTPEGLLIRVSTLDDVSEQYAVHDDFIRDLMSTISPEIRPKFGI
jgi:EpsI family protein